MAGGGRRDGYDPDVFSTVLELSERVSKVEQEVKDLKEEVREFRNVIRDEMRKLEDEIRSLRMTEERRNGFMRYMIIILIIILSFVAAVLGVKWHPP